MTPPRYGEKGFASNFNETPTDAWAAYVDARIRRKAQLRAIGLDEKHASAEFHTPYFAKLYKEAQESGGPVEAEHRELVGAIRELRKVLRYMKHPRINQEHPRTISVVAFVEANIDMMRASLQRGDDTVSPVMCLRCGDHPRWFGDLCSRCADEEGQRPHGKVGEEL